MFDALRPGAGGFGGAATAPANPFGQLHPAQTPATNPFASATTSNISSNPFAQTQQTTTPVPAASNPFSGQIKPSNPFGANGVAQSSSQPFAQPNSSTIKASPFGSTPFQSSAGSLANAAPAQPTWPGVKPTIGKRKGDVEGQSESKFPRSSPDPQVASNRHTSASRGGHSGRGQHVSTRPQQPRAPTRPATDKDSGLAVKVHAALAKDNLRPPQWPANPGSDGQRKAAENFREAYITYREKARKCLIKANLIDDPDKRRALSDALQFKGICEHMCPDWERITRIVQHDVKREEREDVNGESQANIELMVTRHARSSAGQDAPLPMDVRSPGALKRTLRYMIDELIPEDHFLPARHNFLWDRTRAIRKDFIYQEYAMGHDEMRDYIYCLETIARFHVTALHLLTQSDFAGKDFSAQQENEQLEKTLISLMQAYDDCAKQGIDCDNEADFRSYYIIVMADNPAWMDVVQSFAARFWNDSDSIRTASILVESLKNIWDMQGPLMPPGTSEMALPAISTFFDIVSSPAISYTMACFAEIHFPKIRRLMLKILREAYWRPKTGPVDLTPAVIRRQLRLDSDEEAIEFAKSQGFTFNVANGQMYAVNNARQALSEDKPPRMFSRSIVERKRGNHSLAEVIYTTFYEEPSGAEPVSTEADSLFVDGSQDVQSHIHYQAAERFISTPPVSQPQSPFALPSPAAQDASPKFQTPAMSASESAPGGAQNVFTKPNSTTDGISGTTTSGSVNWLAKSSAPPGPFSLSQTAASPSIPEGKRSALEPAKPSPAFNLAKSSPLASSFGQQPLSSSSPSIFASKPTEQSSLDKPTSSILSGAASSCATGFVFPNSATVEIPKARPPISASSEPNAERPSSNTFQHLASASQVAPPNVGLGSSKTNAASTTTEASNQDITDSASTSSGFKSSLKPQPAQDNRANRSPAQPQNDPMDLLARWYVCADRGLMEEHLEQWMLESILLKTFEGFEETELERVRKEEDEQSWAEARKFREYSLGVTYFYRWLDKFRKRRAVKRIQLEKQKAKEWNLPENRAKRAAAAQVVKEKSLRASKQLLAQKMSTHMSQHNRVATSPANANRRPRRDSLEDALLVPQNKNLAGSAPPPVSLDTNQLALSDEPLPGEKNLLRFENQRRKKRGLQPLRKYPEAKTYREGSKSAMLKALSSGMGRDTMSMSTNSLRNSTFSSSYRSSLGFNGSRISKPTSRVSDPYWKLKANGLVQMPNGEYLHESLALPMLEEGVRFPGIGDYGISGSSRASVSESPGGSIDIPEFSPPPQPSAQEQRNGIDSFHRRRSRVSMSPAASTSGLHQYHNRIDQPRPHSLSLRRDRKRGYEHLDDDDEEDGLHYVGSASLAANDQDSGREGSVGGGGGGGLHKRARSGGRRVISSAIAGNMGPAAAATATDAQSVASLDDSDFLASIDRLLKDVQDASKVLS